jgi:PKD domain
MQKLHLTCLLLLCSYFTQAQLFVDTSYTYNQMINTFFGNAGLTISNITYTGAPQSLAFFEGSQSNLGLNAGLMMTTGDALLAVGPNISEDAGVAIGNDGTEWLNSLIPGYFTHDATIIEMDIVPNNDTLAFKYVFGSEEYLEYVNTTFNDLFAFFITGPGFATSDSIYVEPDTAIVVGNDCFTCIDTFLLANTTYCFSHTFDTTLYCVTFDVDTLIQDCYYDPAVCGYDTLYYPGYWYVTSGGTNIAQIPNTNLPVAINTLNQFDNTQYFIDNELGTTVEYDAFTTPLWAFANVIPGETYHIRIAIADAGDEVFDSGVFLSIESLDGDSLLQVDPEFLAIPNGNTVQFDNQTLWATNWEWDFGDGMGSNLRQPEHTYAANGTYTVTVKASNWCSEESFSKTVEIGAVSGTNEALVAPFDISPNPANGTVVLNLHQLDQATVRLTSMDGRLCFEGTVNDGQRINLAPYGQGMFLMQVQAGDRLWTEKIINR